jgi:N6-adenosine-specific RNA methylase IME4
VSVLTGPAIVRRVDEIIVGKRHRRELGDVASLARSIERNTLLHPIVIHPDGRLIAGERRLEAHKLLGRSEIPVTVVDLGEIMLGELAENADRKDFLPSEIEAIRRALEPVEKAAARERETLGKVCLGSETGKTRDRVGAFAGVSGETVRKITAIVAAAEAEPERFGKLAADMDRTGRVDGPFKRLKVARQAEAIRKEPPPLPGNGPYRGIVADVPWPYEKRQEDPSNRGVHPYPSLSIAQICAMGPEVKRIAAKDCVLWFWTTNHHMREAFQVLDAWGFEQKTILTWVKDRMGMGDWLRGQTEHCLMAVRGKPVVQLTNQTTVFYGKVREHSRKPEEFYALVEKLCPAPRYCELFSRHARPNWDGHGDEHPAAAGNQSTAAT